MRSNPMNKKPSFPPSGIQLVAVDLDGNKLEATLTPMPKAAATPAAKTKAVKKPAKKAAKKAAPAKKKAKRKAKKK